MPKAYLKAAREAIEQAVIGLDPDTIARDVPGRWSIGEILEHLTLAFQANAAVFEKALASGELRARPPKLHERIARMLVINVGYFPRVKAPVQTTPSRRIPPDRSVSAILDALTVLDATMARMSERFGDRVRVCNHPYFAGLTLPQWRKFHWRHTRHHVRQVRELTLSRTKAVN